jgi:hypothetical protein
MCQELEARAATARLQEQRQVPDRNQGEFVGHDLPPRRADVDRLDCRAAEADRKGWDGKPTVREGRRLYALRESGWTGPIDQDGYADATSDGAATLRRMAQDRGETVDW